MRFKWSTATIREGEWHLYAFRGHAASRSQIAAFHEWAEDSLVGNYMVHAAEYGKWVGVAFDNKQDLVLACFQFLGNGMGKTFIRPEHRKRYKPR